MNDTIHDWKMAWVAWKGEGVPFFSFGSVLAHDATQQRNAATIPSLTCFDCSSSMESQISEHRQKKGKKKKEDGYERKLV